MRKIRYEFLSLGREINSKQQVVLWTVEIKWQFFVRLRKVGAVQYVSAAGTYKSLILYVVGSFERCGHFYRIEFNNSLRC